MLKVRPQKHILALLLALALLCPPIPVHAASGWVEQDGQTYFLVGDGQALTGWQNVDGLPYYFHADGRRAAGWTAIGSQLYYFGADGAAYTGIRYVGQSRNMYVFSADGALRRGGTVMLRGKEYPVSINGVVEGYLTGVTRMAADVLDQVGWDLRAAFDWSASLTYYDRSMRAPEGEEHTAWYAGYGFTNGYGNCYVMSAVFYQMARLLGYDAAYIEGGVGSARGTVIDHCWTEIKLEGETFVFDPDFTNEEGRDGYQIWYGKEGTWYYYKFGPDGQIIMEGVETTPAAQ